MNNILLLHTSHLTFSDPLFWRWYSHSLTLWCSAMLFSNDINRNGIDLNIFSERSLEQNLLNVLCINSPQCTKEIQFSSSKQTDKRILGLDQPCKTVRLEVKDNSSNNKIEKENEERKEIQYQGGFCNWNHIKYLCSTNDINWYSFKKPLLGLLHGSSIYFLPWGFFQQKC